MKTASAIRIMHIASGDLWAGAEAQLFTLAKALNKRKDINLTLVLLNHGTLEDKLQANNIHVSVLDESRLNGLQILLQLVRVIKETRPDVIHTHRVKENILGGIAAAFNHIPTLRTTHGAPEHKPAWNNIPQKTILFLDRLSGRFLQKQIIAVSEDLAEILQEDFPADRITVIENGIDLSLFNPSDQSDSTDIQSDTDRFRVGIAGRLVPVKRMDIFIRVAAELLSSHPQLNAQFHIFGDGPLRTELENLSRQLGAETVIHFEGHCRNMHQALANLDALLITSDHEGLPMILLEAMALKTPVIAHAVGGIPRVLNHGECGLLIPGQHASDYAAAVHMLIKNPGSRKNYIHNAFDRVRAFYSSEQNADRYHAVYRKLVHTTM